MGNLLACVFSILKRHKNLNSLQEYMENPSMEVPTASMINGKDGFHVQLQEQNAQSSEKNWHTPNIIDNHTFSNGLHAWYANCCDAFLVSPSVKECTPKSCKRHAVVTNRTQNWQGLEQDITRKVSPGSTYKVSARVGVSGTRLKGKAEVIATIKLEYQHSRTKHLNITRTAVSKDEWANLEGTFVLSDKPDSIVFYIEGPAPGVNILIESVCVLCHGKSEPCCYTHDGNIIVNPGFEDGVNNWTGRGCKIAVHESTGDGKILPKSGKFFAATAERTQSWNGIQQDITGKVQRKLAYEITAFVRIFGNNVTSTNVRATLRVQTPDSREQYIGIANSQVTDSDWTQLQGKFLLNGMQSKVVIYLEGPPPGTDILLDGLVVQHAEKIPPSPEPDIELQEQNAQSSKKNWHTPNIIDNHTFSNGLHAWYANCCDAFLVSPSVKECTPKSCKRHAVVTNRTQNWQGLEQDITRKVSPGSTYKVSARVGVSGTRLKGKADVIATIKLEYQHSRTKHLNITRTAVSKDEWANLEGTFVLSDKPDSIVFYIEGPAPGVNILIESVCVLCHGKSEPCCYTHDGNIIVNPGFEDGVNNWTGRGCKIAVHESTGDGKILPKSGKFFAATAERTQSWNGIQQDITGKVQRKLAYEITAFVRIFGNNVTSTNVRATLRVQTPDSREQYIGIANSQVTDSDWTQLQGKFLLNGMQSKVVIYLEGPPPGTDILLDGLVVQHAEKIPPSPEPDIELQEQNAQSSKKNWHTPNIIDNHTFSNGLHAWYANCCDAFLVSPSVKECTPKSCKRHAVVTNRTQNWQGLEQDITRKVSPGSTYKVSARVGVSGTRLKGKADVIATIKLEYQHSRTKHLNITRTAVSKDEWANLEGTFVLSDKPDSIVFYIEGPAPGVNILIESVCVLCHGKSEPCCYTHDGNIIVNPGFEDGVNNWTGRGCKIAVHESMGDGKILPKSGKFFAATAERTQSWNGIQQDITGKVQRKLAYEITAFVRIFGNNVTSTNVRATLWVQTPDSREQYIGIANSQVTDSDWTQLQGKFLLNGMQSKVVIYLEGPPPGTDILLDGLVVQHAEKIPPSPEPDIENPDYGVNIITNSNLSDGTNGWFPLGSCVLKVMTGSPHILPPAARDTLGPHVPLSGRCIHITNRTQTWMGPAQMITDNVKLYVTYQVSAWVRLGPGANGPHNVNVALGVDSQWVNGGQVEINDAERWHEICGSFRIEKQAAKVMVYIQGPAAGTSFMVAGLQIFAVDRQARFRHLKRQTDLIRKRDVTLKFPTPDLSNMYGTTVIVKQTQNSFPIGTCISRTNIDNEDFVAFFVKNFNWAVFGNEFKWYWTESQQGKLNYKDVDDLLKLCDDNNIAARGHCIFWDVDNTVQDWVKNLSKTDLATAVQNRLTSLLYRYKGKFKHYDVNNEMLHGSFYPNRLGQDIRPNMFKTANQLDPSATLFVNDYHIEDGCDTRSTPEKYIAQILDLQQKGAPVGGIGIQGHIDSPVGPIVCSALDKLGILGLPIWFTELDVSSINEHIRADDLEVMLREAFAHPAVEGIILWGFWELFMSRDNSHLVNAEGDINEAGNRLLQLKKEWMSHTHGHVDEQGEFKFRGFPGTYEVVVVTDFKKTVKKFVVEKGDDPLILIIDP